MTRGTIPLALAIPLLALAWACPAGAQSPPPASEEGSPLALVGARVLSPGSPPIEEATVVIRAGRVVSVTPRGPVPAGARRLDLAGATLTPGFVGTMTPLGMVEISMERATSDERPEAEGSDPVRAAFSAADAYDPLSSLIAVARREGVTSAVSTPTGGLIAGTSAWVDLAGELPEEALVRTPTALHVDLGDPGVESAGGARPAALSRLREALEDARYFAAHRAAYDRRGARPMRLSRLDLEVLAQALSGALPVVVEVSRSGDILRVLELARSYRLRLILAGCEEGWVVASRIAAADVPVIVQPLVNLPERLSSLRARRDNAALLARAGVRLILRTDSAHDLSRLRLEAGNAVAAGLSPDAALAALTSEPARAFGLDADRGRIAPGQVANLVAWNGDPFELGTWATQVFIGGRQRSLRSRQSALLERYRDLSCVRRGRAPSRPLSSPLSSPQRSLP